jgi:hypothetical protein
VRTSVTQQLENCLNCAYFNQAAARKFELTVGSTLQVPLPLHCAPPGVATGHGTPSVVSPIAAAAAALLLPLPMLRVSMRLLLLLLPVGFATRHDARMA